MHVVGRLTGWLDCFAQVIRSAKQGYWMINFQTKNVFVIVKELAATKTFFSSVHLGRVICSFFSKIGYCDNTR